MPQKYKFVYLVKNLNQSALRSGESLAFPIMHLDFGRLSYA